MDALLEMTKAASELDLATEYISMATKELEATAAEVHTTSPKTCAAVRSIVELMTLLSDPEALDSALQKYEEATSGGEPEITADRTLAVLGIDSGDRGTIENLSRDVDVLVRHARQNNRSFAVMLLGALGERLRYLIG